MINKNNYKLTEEYLEQVHRNHQQKEGTTKNKRSRLRHLLNWCGETEFFYIPKRNELYREYISKETRENGEPLSNIYKRKIIEEAKLFFQWLSIRKSGYQLITPAWLDTFRYKKSSYGKKSLKSITEEEIKRLANLPAKTLTEKRTRASVCALYITGMRIDAFVTLPISAIDFQKLSVRQDPNLGVRTKNNKSADTFIIKLDGVFEVAQEWDELVRSEFPQNALWFAPLSSQTGEFDYNKSSAGIHRATIFRKNLKSWLTKNGIQENITPHSFRRGHANFLFDHAMEMADLVAAQNNLMHESLTTTEMYARQRQEQTKMRILAMSQRNSSTRSTIYPNIELFIQKAIKETINHFFLRKER